MLFWFFLLGLFGFRSKRPIVIRAFRLSVEKTNCFRLFYYNFSRLCLVKYFLKTVRDLKQFLMTHVCKVLNIRFRYFRFSLKKYLKFIETQYLSYLLSESIQILELDVSYKIVQNCTKLLTKTSFYILQF